MTKTKTDFFVDYLSAKSEAERLAALYFEKTVDSCIRYLAEAIADQVLGDCDFADLSFVEEKTAEVANEGALDELLDGLPEVIYNARARAMVTGYEYGKDHTAWDRFQEEFGFSPEGWRADNQLAFAVLNWEIQEQLDEVAMVICEIAATKG